MLLRGYLPALLDGDALTSPEISHTVATHLHDLIALSVGTTRECAFVAGLRSIGAARLRAIKSDILANLSDCGLTLATVATRQRVTPRYVHKLFEREGTTYTQFVLERRLRRSHRMLCNHRHSARSISAVAFDVGFGDLSYFNRTFRRRYTATPSDVRRRAGG